MFLNWIQNSESCLCWPRGTVAACIEGMLQDRGALVLEICLLFHLAQDLEPSGLEIVYVVN